MPDCRDFSIAEIPTIGKTPGCGANGVIVNPMPIVPPPAVPILPPIGPIEAGSCDPLIITDFLAYKRVIPGYIDDNPTWVPAPGSLNPYADYAIQLVSPNYGGMLNNVNSLKNSIIIPSPYGTIAVSVYTSLAESAYLNVAGTAGSPKCAVPFNRSIPFMYITGSRNLYGFADAQNEFIGEGFYCACAIHNYGDQPCQRKEILNPVGVGYLTMNSYVWRYRARVTGWMGMGIPIYSYERFGSVVTNVRVTAFTDSPTSFTLEGDLSPMTLSAGVNPVPGWLYDQYGCPLTSSFGGGFKAIVTQVT